MQTFLPYPDFARSAAVLDPARLGKQRVETLQMLRALELPDYGWRNHPAVTMWRGRTPALVAYGLACVSAWTTAARVDTTREQIAEFAPEVVERTQAELNDAGLLPTWLGDDRLHASHRSALLRKDPAFYGHAFGDVPQDLPYVWPDADPVEPAPDLPAGVPVWVVRPDGEEFPRRTGTSGAVDLPLSSRSGRRSPKWQRQVRAFTQEMDVGDLVAVPVDGGARLILGTVTGDSVGDGVRFRRTVHWTTRVERADVHRPATLQDPRCLFQVRVRL